MTLGSVHCQETKHQTFKIIKNKTIKKTIKTVKNYNKNTEECILNLNTMQPFNYLISQFKEYNKVNKLHFPGFSCHKLPLWCFPK